MLAILVDCRALLPVRLYALNPFVTGFSNGDAFTRRRVHTALDVDARFGRLVFRLAFSRKGLDMSNPVLVEGIDYPCFLVLAPPSRPFALAYRHSCPPLCYVAYVA